MTLYIAERNNVQVPAGITRLTLAPTTLAIKVLKVEFSIGTSSTLSVYRSVGTTTGGTTFTPAPLRDGPAAPSPTATAKYNVTSISGTPVYFENLVSSTSSPYQPFASLMVPVGSVFVVEASTAGNYVYIHYDEQRLQGGF